MDKWYDVLHDLLKQEVPMPNYAELGFSSTHFVIHQKIYSSLS